MNNYVDDYIPSYIEETIIQYWLMGYTRDEIAQEFHISTGTASNIWAKFRNKLGHYEADALRELGKQLRRQNMTTENCAKGFRISKFIEKLGIPEEKIKEFLTTIYEISQKMSINPETLRDALIEFAQISDKVPFSEIPSYLQKKNEEIKGLENKEKQLEEEIENLEKEKAAKEEQVRSTLREANTTLFHLDIFVKTKNKLESYGITVEDIDKFTRYVEGIEKYSNYDPFKVISKFSDLNTLENENENKQKEKNDLEIKIQKLKERESEYEDRLNLKFIKLKNLDELEKTGFTIQDLKKLKRILIEIILEHKHLNIEQIKALFFELLEKNETRIALEGENNRLLQIITMLQNQIKGKRHILHYQQLVGPILKNLFDIGIRESDIVAIKALIDILLNTLGNNIDKLNERQEIIKDFSSYSNLKLAKANMIIEINTILNTENLEKIQKHIDSLNKSFSSSINNSENLSERKQVVLCDSII